METNQVADDTAPLDVQNHIKEENLLEAIEYYNLQPKKLGVGAFIMSILYLVSTFVFIAWFAISPIMVSLVNSFFKLSILGEPLLVLTYGSFAFTTLTIGLPSLILGLISIFTKNRSLFCGICAIIVITATVGGFIYYVS